VTCISATSPCIACGRVRAAVERGAVFRESLVAVDDLAVGRRRSLPHRFGGVAARGDDLLDRLIDAVRVEELCDPTVEGAHEARFAD
jgi:hypothetical protein